MAKRKALMGSEGKGLIFMMSLGMSPETDAPKAPSGERLRRKNRGAEDA